VWGVEGGGGVVRGWVRACACACARARCAGGHIRVASASIRVCPSSSVRVYLSLSRAAGPRAGWQTVEITGTSRIPVLRDRHDSHDSDERQRGWDVLRGGCVAEQGATSVRMCECALLVWRLCRRGCVAEHFGEARSRFAALRACVVRARR
jgi:hypothetical protein